jgi:hypothetical protein
MNALSSSNPYANAYPLAGKVALLCEGDVAGYEIRLLKEWADINLRTNPLVDVWACGTATAIYGVSDAIGRSRPILVIEDRDFRSVAEAEDDCRKQAKDRAKREIRVLEWRTWRRNEIENYFLVPGVLLPTMADIFKCRPEDVQQAIVEVLVANVVFQAAQYALYRARHAWAESDPSAPLRNNLDIHPQWDDSNQRVSPPDAKSALEILQKNVSHWRNSFVDAPDSTTPDHRMEVVQSFEQKLEEWKSVTWEDSRWREDWSGKEILQWLRIVLTGRFGWADSPSSPRAKLSWGTLGRSRRNQQDRPIEARMKPVLERRFLAHLQALTSGELFDEWNGLFDALRAANSPPPADPFLPPAEA